MIKKIKYYKPCTINIESGEITEWPWHYEKIHKPMDYHEIAWWEERTVYLEETLSSEDLLLYIEKELKETALENGERRICL